MFGCVRRFTTLVGALLLVLLLIGGSLPGSPASAQVAATATTTPTPTATTARSAASPSPSATATATATTSPSGATPTTAAATQPPQSPLLLPLPQGGPPSPSANAAAVPASPNEVVYGQTSFTSNSSGDTASTLYEPTAVALDSSGNVYVADYYNNRVLEFPSSCSSAGCSATRVFGQADFASNSYGDTASTLDNPTGVAVDSSGNVYVLDHLNNRVLEFPSNCPTTSCSATRVFGQSNFNSGSPGDSASTLYYPYGVALDSSGNVYVADYTNHRVVEFPSSCISTGCSATRVFGQTSFTTQSSGDTASTLHFPTGVGVDSSGTVYVSDYGNNRVLEFPSSCASTGCSATRVFGQTSFTTGSSADTASTLFHPNGVAVDSSGTVYVSDYGNNRVLGFPSSCPSAGCSATKVYGQTSFTSNTAGLSGSGLYAPFGLALDSSGNLYVADYLNNRVLGRMPVGATSGGSSTHLWSDFNGDGITDVGLFRPSSGLWYILLSGGGTQSQPNLGATGDTPVTADFDGDGKADLVYWNASTGQWFGTLSGGGLLNCYLGQSGDIPIPGDYTGAGSAGPAIFRPSTGLWYGLNTTCSSSTLDIQSFGQSGDIPIPRDYDGDGKFDPALFRPSSGLWYAILSSGGSKSEPSFGQSTDIPVPMDYDGDGKADFTFYRPSTGQWYGLLSGGGAMNVYLGQSGDVPIPANYKSTGADGPAIFRAGSGLWYGVNGPSGSSVTLDIQGLGQSGDVPLPERPQ